MKVRINHIPHIILILICTSPKRVGAINPIFQWENRQRLSNFPSIILVWGSEIQTKDSNQRSVEPKCLVLYCITLPLIVTVWLNSKMMGPFLRSFPHPKLGHWPQMIFQNINWMPILCNARDIVVRRFSQRSYSRKGGKLANDWRMFYRTKTNTWRGWVGFYEEIMPRPD